MYIYIYIAIVLPLSPPTPATTRHHMYSPAISRDRPLSSTIRYRGRRVEKGSQAGTSVIEFEISGWRWRVNDAI